MLITALTFILYDYVLQICIAAKSKPTDNSNGILTSAAYICRVRIRDGVLCSGMHLYLHHRDSKISFHPAKFDNFKDEKISAFKTVSVSQRKNLLDSKLVV